MKKIPHLSLLLAFLLVLGCGEHDDSHANPPENSNTETTNPDGNDNTNPNASPNEGTQGDSQLEDGTKPNDQEQTGEGTKPNDQEQTGEGTKPNDQEQTGEGNQNGAKDPCQDVVCHAGTCHEGICVTEAMKQLKDESDCDPETFVSFCDGNRTVYCDRGTVMSGMCDEGCAVYDETFHGKIHRKSGCIDGGACTALNALKRSCSIVSGVGQVLATACQMTTRGTMKWISVDGYYCQGACDSKNEMCALQEGECDPYHASNYACDRQNLKTCQLDSNLQAHTMTQYCDEACIKVNGIAMCGYACTTEDAREDYCVTVGNATVTDLGDFVCTKTDSGELYNIWTGMYDYCHQGCNASTRQCR